MGSIIQDQSKAISASPKRKSIQELIKVMEPEIRKALPTVLTPDRFTRMVLSALSTNPKLSACTPTSFLGAMMQAAQLGVEPNTPLGQAYLIPYKNHGVDEVQFQLGYRGMIDLAYRSGEVSTIQAHTVYSKDSFSYELGLEPSLKHIPARTDRGSPTHYYAVIKMKDGGYSFAVMSIEDIKAHQKRYSKASFGPWQSNFDEMAKKTVLKKALKYAPLKSEFVRGISADETIKTEVSEDMYTVTDTTVYSDDLSDVHETEEAIDLRTDPETGEVMMEGNA